MVDANEKTTIHVPLSSISEPTANDVLSGRGVTTNRHPGNVSYRSLVALNKVGVECDSLRCVLLSLIEYFLYGAGILGRFS